MRGRIDTDSLVVLHAILWCSMLTENKYLTQQLHNNSEKVLYNTKNNILNNSVVSDVCEARLSICRLTTTISW